ncbi:flavoprotein [Streptomyces boninensis]|uniref:flavoprotein n=1 Tax=Streptomyces boninensis TaxID=2039455 RepID=UPI003B228747
MASRVLYLFGSAAPPVFDIRGVVKTAQADGWDMCLGLTPTAARYLDEQLPELEALTGHPVRSQYKLPGQPDAWPSCSVAVLAPATFNSINQWALGITEKFVVGFLAEAIGKGIPLVTMPCVNLAFAKHPQFEQSIAALRGAGVEVLYGDGGFVPHPPGGSKPNEYPWELALDGAARRTR